MTLFAVLTRGRTGSTPLVDDIDRHPDIACHQELFRQEPVNNMHDKAPSYEAVRQNGRTPGAEDYLREVAAATPGKTVGFKALMTHLEQRHDIGLESFMFGSSMPIVFLTRDPVRAALSATIAKERKLFSIRVDQKQQDHDKQPVVLDPTFVADEARYYAHWSDHWQARLRELKTPHIVVTYEQYVADRLALVNTIFRFLKVRELPELPSNSYAKVTSDDVWKDVANSDEVRKALSRIDLYPAQPRTRARRYLDRALASVRRR